MCKHASREKCVRVASANSPVHLSQKHKRKQSGSSRFLSTVGVPNLSFFPASSLFRCERILFEITLANELRGPYNWSDRGKGRFPATAN